MCAFKQGSSPVLQRRKFSLFAALLFILLGTSSEISSAAEPPIHQYIIGGSIAPNGAWPWAAALVAPGTKSAFCGGSLIGSKWVLTAGHCAYNRQPTAIDVLLGQNDLNGTDGEKIHVAKIYVNPGYRPDSRDGDDGDIALLELAKPSSVAQTVSLPTAAIAAKLSPGTLTTVIGWGATGFSQINGAFGLSALLRQVDVPIIGNTACQNMYTQFNITSNMICAGYPQGLKDSCNGDSGGPLMLQSGGRWYVVGVVSFGEGCALAQAPGVYARVSTLQSWITSVTGIPAGAGSGIGPGPVTPQIPTTPPSDFSVCEIPSTKEITATPNDTDGDGISDSQELLDSTDTNDKGSYVDHLGVPIHALWNGFLGVTNIAELVNPGDSAVSVRISLLGIDGKETVNFVKTIQPFSQRDIIVNDLPGFKADSYGLLKFEYCGGKLDGRISYYRSLGPDRYDFAYSIPFAAPNFGDAAVTFNTFQPSLSFEDQATPVANWLSVVNLSLSTKRFTIRRYLAGGEFVDERELQIPGGERRDIEAGHVVPGPRFYGLVEILPLDKNAPYLSQLVRIGSAVGSDGGINYPYAFPFKLRSGSSKLQLVPITTTLDSQSWLEVVNPSEFSTEVSVEFYLSSGEFRGIEKLSLTGHSQSHLSVNNHLGKDAVGYAKLQPIAGSLVFATGMVYSINDLTGKIRNVYGSQSAEAVPATRLAGSFNLFLGMSNWLKVINPGDQPVTIKILTNTADGIHENKVVVPGGNSRDFGLHEAKAFGTSSQTLGVFQITSASAVNLFTELIRVRPDATDGGVNFIFPTTVRQ